MASPAPDPGLFSPLPRWSTPWSELFFSYGTQAVVIAICVWIPVLHPEILAAEEVQTGRFGDPNGIPANPSRGKAVNIAQAGGFDLPTGPGYGNGTAGANGVRGVVASTGFGGGVAKVDARPTRTSVRQAGF